MSTPRWLADIVDSIPRLQRPAGEDTSLTDFADWMPDDGNGWTPEVPSVLEEKPPRVPIIPDPPRPVEYRDQAYWDGIVTSQREERGQWLSHADDLAMWLDDLPRARKRRNQQVARLRKAVAATPLPSQAVS